MPIPVLIPARNEAYYIESTLEGLPRDVEPIVLANGCNDETEMLARQSGAQVLVSEVEGKMPAIQAGIRYLGKRSVEPFVIMDADTRPLFPRKWLAPMLEAAQTAPMGSPSIVNGPVMFVESDIATLAWRNAGLWRFMLRNRHNPGQGVSGANMLLDLQNSKTVDEILALPHYWPREDAAMRDTVLDSGGHSVKVFDPRAIALTSADRFVDICTRIVAGREQTDCLIKQSYLDEAAPNSVPYELYNL